MMPIKTPTVERRRGEEGREPDRQKHRKSLWIEGGVVAFAAVVGDACEVVSGIGADRKWTEIRMEEKEGGKERRNGCDCDTSFSPKVQFNFSIERSSNLYNPDLH